MSSYPTAPGIYVLQMPGIEMIATHVSGDSSKFETCIPDTDGVEYTAHRTAMLTCTDGNVWSLYVNTLHTDRGTHDTPQDRDHDYEDHDHDENAKTMASNVWDCFHNGNCKRAASTPAVERATIVVNGGEQKSILISMVDVCFSSKFLAARATTSTPPPVVIVTSTTTMKPPVVSSTPTSSRAWVAGE